MSDSHHTATEKSASPSRTDPKLRNHGLHGPLALSFAQHVFVSSYDRLSAPEAQHMVLALRLVGALDTSALQASIQHLTARHAILRAHYAACDGDMRALIRDDVVVPMHILDMSGATPQTADAAVRDAINQQSRTRFALSSGPLLRTTLVRLSADHHVFAVIVHHSVCDAWSFNVLTRDLATTYEALLDHRIPALPHLPIQFTDYAAWLREMIDSEAGRHHLNYWRSRLSGVRRPFWLPRDQPAPSAADGPKHPDGMSLGSEAVLALRNFARRNGTTVPIVILAAFAVVLSRWSELDDIVITLIHFARLHPQTWSLIGCFMQAWVLRAELYGQMSFDDVVRQIHRTTVEAQPHIQIPFFMTKQLLARASEEKPLLHVTFNYIPAHQFMQQASWTRDLSATVFPMQTEVPGALDEARGEKLILNIFDEPNSIRAILRYSSSRFSRETIERFWEHFCGFFHRAIPDPAEAARPLRRVPLSSSRAE